MQQGDSAMRLHFLGSLAGLGAHTEIPKKSLLDCTPLDFVPKRDSRVAERPWQGWLPPQEDFGSGTNRIVSDAGTAALTLGHPHALLLAAEAGMPEPHGHGIPLPKSLLRDCP